VDRARRQAYLDAMGIQAWLPRDRLSGAQPDGGATAGPQSAPDTQPSAAAAVGGFPSDMLRAALRGEAPIRDASEPVATPPVTAERPPSADRVPAAADLSTLDWPQLAERVAACTACGLHQARTQAVFGVGDQQARLLIIGEAPGADEDRLGEPFVGRAGQLLNAMLGAIGLRREQVYIANILKCRPPGNRNPAIEEVAACQGFLARQIALLQPQLILAVGAISAHNLLGSEESVGRLRGRLHRLPSGIPVLVSYHPAYLLRRPEEKAKAWQDLQQVARLLRGDDA
jgi:DNA polymerase